MKKKKKPKARRNWTRFLIGAVSVNRLGLRATGHSKKGTYVLEVPWSKLNGFVVRHGTLRHPRRKVSKKDKARAKREWKSWADRRRRFRAWEAALEKKRRQKKGKGR